MATYKPDDRTVLLDVEIPEDWDREIRWRAGEAGTDASQIVRRALSIYLFGELRYPEQVSTLLTAGLASEAAAVDPLLAEDDPLAEAAEPVFADSEKENPDVREV